MMTAFDATARLTSDSVMPPTAACTTCTRTSEVDSFCSEPTSASCEPCTSVLTISGRFLTSPSAIWSNMFSSFAACWLGQLDVAELTLTEQTDFTRLALVGHDHDFFTGNRHFGQALDLDRNRWTGFGDRLAVFVQHRADAAIRGTSQDHVAAPQGTGLDQDRRDRALALVETAFNHQAACRRVDRGFQFQHFGLQQYLLEQVVDTLAGFCRHWHERRLATVFFRHNLFGDQFLRHALDVAARFVDLVDRHDQRYAGSFRVGDRFLRLRHHAVVGRHHQDDDVGCLGATGTHCRKGFVTRGVEEGDHAAWRFDVVSADVLRNAARFARCHLGAADVVQQRGLAVVDVTHDGNHRCARGRLEVSVLTLVGQQCFRIVFRRGKCLVAHFFHENHRGFLVQHLVDGAHLAQLHQLLDDFGCLDGHLVRQFGDRDGLRNVNVLDDRFGRRLEIGFAVVRVRSDGGHRARRHASRHGRSATLPRGLIAAWCAAFLGVVRPGRRHIGRLDRLLVRQRLLVGGLRRPA